MLPHSTLVKLIMQTGVDVDRALVILSVEKLRNATPPQTSRAPQPTKAQVAKRARAALRYAENKAAIYYRDRGLCQHCGRGGVRRKCKCCNGDVCEHCMPGWCAQCCRCPLAGSDRPLPSDRLHPHAHKYADEVRRGDLAATARALTAAARQLPGSTSMERLRELLQDPL